MKPGAIWLSMIGSYPPGILQRIYRIGRDVRRLEDRRSENVTLCLSSSASSHIFEIQAIFSPIDLTSMRKDMEVDVDMLELDEEGT